MRSSQSPTPSLEASILIKAGVQAVSRSLPVMGFMFLRKPPGRSCRRSASESDIFPWREILKLFYRKVPAAALPTAETGQVWIGLVPSINVGVLKSLRSLTPTGTGHHAAAFAGAPFTLSWQHFQTLFLYRINICDDGEGFSTTETPTAEVQLQHR